MCGICGLFNFDSEASIDPNSLQDMCNTLHHRGPDDEGMFLKGFLGIAMKRLSIIDLSGGRQPIDNEDGNVQVILNGEIYNYQELRQRLTAAGHRFKTNSDTEAIVHLYEESPADFVTHLRGMFAFALWDDRRRELIIARDRLGIKPLFYSNYKGCFYFASEMKAILKNAGIPREIDENAVAAYFTLGYIPAPLTIYQGIRKLLPGHMLRVRLDGVRTERYWELRFAPNRARTEDQTIEEFMSILQEAVKIRLISDVPLGAFLSGGVDSSTVVALMSKVSDAQMKTFSIGFGGDVGGYLDEREFAAIVAERFATRHSAYEVQPNPHGLIEKIVGAFDEPFGDDSTIPSYFVCKIARENVTVALSGLGGDELFAGYERYLGFHLGAGYEKLPELLRNGIVRNIIENLPERADGHYTINHMKRFVRASMLPPDLRYFHYLSMLRAESGIHLFRAPEQYKEPLDRCREAMLAIFNAADANDNSHPSNALNQVFYCDMMTYLPEDILAVTDRISMLHSLEVRVPFLDHHLVEYCATIPPEMKLKWFRKKYLLKKAVSGLLPRAVVNHRKQGFASPMARWLHKDLKPYVLEMLSEENIKKSGVLAYPTVEKVLNEHFDRKELNDKLIWSMLIFQIWYQMYMN